MGLYNNIFTLISQVKENKSEPVCIEVNKFTHDALVEDMKSQTKTENILSIETIFKLPLFINQKLKDHQIVIKTNIGKMNVCIDCFDKYVRFKGNIAAIAYKDEECCEICRHVRKTTKVPITSVDFNEIKHNIRPNIYS